MPAISTIAGFFFRMLLAAFLGAGVILSDGTKVKGINTAATVWASAAVGTLCCLDKFWYAAIIAAAVVVSHLVIHPITEAIKKRRK